MNEQMKIDIERLAAKWKGKQGSLIMILHDLQEFFGYVPREASMHLSKFLDVPLARIYEVITFYNYFKLKAPGKHRIAVCMGTACYLKGASEILREFRNLLKINEGETTPDNLFHLDVVRCLGCCGLAPVVMIDNQIHAKVTKEQVADLIAKYAGEKVA